MSQSSQDRVLHLPCPLLLVDKLSVLLKRKHYRGVKSSQKGNMLDLLPRTLLPALRGLHLNLIYMDILLVGVGQVGQEGT